MFFGRLISSFLIFVLARLILIPVTSTMMKQIILLILLMAGPSLVFAQEGPEKPRIFGAGVIFGEPIGPTVKYFFDHEHAIDGGITYSFVEYLLIYADYLYHFLGVFKKHVPELKYVSPYLGIGGGIRISSKDNLDPGDERVNLFIRVPLGVEWMPGNVRLGVFAELVPGMGIAPDVFFLFQGGLGLRYYF